MKPTVRQFDVQTNPPGVGEMKRRGRDTVGSGCVTVQLDSAQR